MDSQFKYPILKTFAKPCWDITDHIKTFGLYSLIATLLVTFLGLIFKQTLLCTVMGMEFQIPCDNSLTLYGIYFFFKLLVITVFLKTWYDAIYLKTKINIDYFKNHIIGFFKFFGSTIIFLLLNMSPILSLYLLIRRVPNPIWWVEALYFTLVSTGFIVPLVVLRFYAVLADLIEGNGFKNLSLIAKKTSGQFGKILFSFGLLLFMCLLLFLLTTGFLRAHIGGNLYFYNILSEFIFSWILVLNSTLMLNFVRNQKELLEI